jgi:uncharacterized protein (TIGR02466 family)
MKKEIKPTVHLLFPIPVYSTSLEREFTSEELNFVQENKKDPHINTGNVTSSNNYILNEVPFLNLKNEINFIVNDYFDKIINPIENKITPYITQSWLNYTESTQYHHTHEHPNSIVSGVLYINADENNDMIKFYNNYYETIKIQPKEYNIYNSKSWWFPVKTGQIVLFPSSTTHSVEVKKGDNTRISLAFNVFIKGILGNNKDLTELVL